MAYKLRISAAGNRTPVAGSLASFNSVTAATLVVVSGTVLAAMLVPGIYVAAALAGVIACVVAIYLVASTLHSKVDNVLLAWLLLSPLGYYFLQFPAEKPIFTLDRLIVIILTGAALFVSRSSATPVPADMRRAAIVWFVFVFFAFTSMVGVWDEVGLGGTRVIVDAFVFPALLALFVIRVFPAERYVRRIHTLLCWTAIYCAAIGVVELLTNTDLLPIPDDTFFGAEQTGSFARVNGPFSTNHCYGTIGAIVLMLLLFLRFLMRDRISIQRRWLHRLGISAAVVMVVLPQFRSLLLGLMLVILLELVQSHDTRARLYVGILVLAIIGGAIALPELLPNFFETRIADPSNLYGRIAQQEQTWELFADHPVNGVGFWNFIEASEKLSNSTFRNVESLNSAHNSLGSILAETGLAGCIPFILANLLWFAAFFRFRNSQLPVARAAWKFFLYTFICYWVMGITLTSAYEHDLNLWYMFACALMYKLALTEQRIPRLIEYL